MKIGFKIYSNTVPEHVEGLIDFTDFIETMIVPGVDYSWLKDYDVPFRVHAPHQGFGVDFTDPKKVEYSKKLLDESIAAADDLNAPTIVLHAGTNGSKELAKEVLEHFASERILIENLITNHPQGIELCSKPREMTEFLDLGFGLCLDFDHLVASCAAENYDYKKRIEEFFLLTPNYFHLSGSLVRSEVDLHISIEKGDIDYKFVKQKILTVHDPWVCLEVPHNLSVNHEEYHFLKEVL